jgi:DNA-binding IclR family transcriptional regulator
MNMESNGQLVATGKNRYIVPGLERGLRLLELFGRQTQTLGAPDISRALGVPRSTVFRLIQTLEHLEFLERAENGDYRLGRAVLRIGFEYLASLDVTDLARPFMVKLRDRTGHAVQLAVRDARDAVIVQKVASSSAFVGSVQVGTRLPAHATAYGRVLMSDLPKAELRKLYPEPRLPTASAHTARSVSALAHLLEQDRARGYVISESYFERSISAVVAPVRDHRGAIVAAMGVTVPHPTLDPALRERLPGLVTQAAGELSRRLNYRPAEQAA